VRSAAARKFFEHAGGLLTADGTGDDLIKLEGVPDGEKFEWEDDDGNVHVEPETYPADKEPADPDDVFTVGDDDVYSNGGIIHDDGHDEMDDSDDEDPDSDDAPAAPCEPPPGFCFLLDPPSPRMLLPGTPEHATLKGRQLLYRWPVVGWCLGVVLVANRDARRTIDRERVNALVHYEIDGEVEAHVLKVEEYGTTESAKWVFVEPVSCVQDGAGEESDIESANQALELECTPQRLADLLPSDSESDGEL